MNLTLTQIVNGALAEADSQIKLASEQQLHIEPVADLDFLPPGETPLEEANEVMKLAQLGDADYAMQLANALDSVGALLPKLANAMPVYAAPFNVGDNTKHSKTSPASIPLREASSGGGSRENSQGYPGGITTNMSEFSDPNWTGLPEAQQGAIRVKGAHPGETKTAGDPVEELLMQQQAEIEYAQKLAQDPSSPAPSGLPRPVADPGMLSTEPPAATAIPDNAGLINMTKRQAHTGFVKRDAAKLLSEPALSARTDKGISDNLSLGVATAKIASRRPDTTEALRALQTDAKTQAALVGGLGALAGAAVGGAERGVGGALVGGLVGGGVGAGSGYLGSKLNKAMYRHADKLALRNSKKKRASISLSDMLEKQAKRGDFASLRPKAARARTAAKILKPPMPLPQPYNRHLNVTELPSKVISAPAAKPEEQAAAQSVQRTVRRTAKRTAKAVAKGGRGKWALGAALGAAALGAGGYAYHKRNRSKKKHASFSLSDALEKRAGALGAVRKLRFLGERSGLKAAVSPALAQKVRKAKLVAAVAKATK